MKTIITGLPYFTGILQFKIQQYNKKDKFIRLNTYYKLYDRLRYLFLLPFTDVVYSVNGTVKGSRVVDLALLFGKRIIFHWVGSDVLAAREDIHNDTFKQSYISRVTHLSDAPWLTEELATFGITSKWIPLPLNFRKTENVPMPAKFSILSYIPKGKEKFYGFDSLIWLAEKLPDVEIKIAGMSVYDEKIPNNIRLLGWVNNMEEEIRKSSVSLRIPEHDGLSFFVIESLMNQRYVIYNKRFDPCIYADDDHSLLQQILELKGRHENDELRENKAGREYILTHFKEADIIVKILDVIQGAGL